MKVTLFLFSFLFCLNSNAQDSLVTTKKSVISLDNIKVVYRGINNPITIAVPNNVKSLSLSGNGFFKEKEFGKYDISPGAGKEMYLKVEMTLKNDSVIYEEHIYQIVDLKSPIGVINNEFNTKGILEFTIDELKNAKVGIKIIDFFYIKGEINRFTVKIPRHPSITIEGNTFTDEVIELLKKVRKKDFIIISNIKCNYIGITASCIKNPSPIVFKIVKD